MKPYIFVLVMSKDGLLNTNKFSEYAAQRSEYYIGNVFKYSDVMSNNGLLNKSKFSEYAAQRSEYYIGNVFKTHFKTPSSVSQSSTSSTYLK